MWSHVLAPTLIETCLKVRSAGRQATVLSHRQAAESAPEPQVPPGARRARAHARQALELAARAAADRALARVPMRVVHLRIGPAPRPSRRHST